MSATRRKILVGVLVVAFLAGAAFGPQLLGAAAGVVVMLMAFVAGFAWLVLLVAPWVVEGRTRPRR